MTISNPLISIITVVFNDKLGLGKIINSVMKQTFGPTVRGYYIQPNSFVKKVILLSIRYRSILSKVIKKLIH